MIKRHPKIAIVVLLGVFAFLLVKIWELVEIKEYPDTDIVYDPVGGINPGIGFINSDGGNNIELPLSESPGQLIWSPDGKTIYMLQFIWMSIGRGLPTIMREGQLVDYCKKWYVSDSIDMVFHGLEPAWTVINHGGVRILLVDLDRCKEIKKLVEKEEHDQTRELIGGSLSPDGKWLVYTDLTNRNSEHPKYSIKIMNVGRREIKEIGSGMNPIWSPDGRWIAYLQLDGIYVMAPDGSRIRRIVNIDLRRELFEEEFALIPPIPRWSPDGQWLLYFLYGTEFSPKEEGIYKVNIESGEVVQLLDHGIYPYWRDR